MVSLEGKKTDLNRSRIAMYIAAAFPSAFGGWHSEKSNMVGNVIRISGVFIYFYLHSCGL